MYELTSGSRYSYFSVPTETKNNPHSQFFPLKEQIYDYSQQNFEEVKSQTQNSDFVDLTGDQSPNEHNNPLQQNNFINEMSVESNYDNMNYLKTQNINNSTVEPIPTIADIKISRKPIVWSNDLYNFNSSRHLDKNKFMSPSVLIGLTENYHGSYNYTYFNNQVKTNLEIFEYDNQQKKLPEKNKSDYNKKSKINPSSIPIPTEPPKNNNQNPISNNNQKNQVKRSYHSSVNHLTMEPPRKINKSRFDSVNKVKTIQIDSIFGRNKSEKWVIILRGLPGSGKSEFCQNFKNKESSLGHTAPRILSLDHFFIEEGKFEYDPQLEPAYREELFKSFKRQIDEGFFTIIILNCVNEKIEHLNQFYNYATINMFNVCILEFRSSLSYCIKRSENKYDPKQITLMSKNWEELPNNFTRLDAASFIQDLSIEEVEMEDANDSEDKDVVVINSDSEDDEDEMSATGFFKSKWDEDFELTKERLDGVKHVSHEHDIDNIKEYLQNELDDMLYTHQNPSENFKKKVKWADTEELKRHQKRKKMGFVAGVTDWSKLMSSDLEIAEQALVQIRYYEKDV